MRRSRDTRYLAGEAGIRQFLDIGTGLPSAGNTHEVAQQIAPECRVVYVDNDPIVLTHARALLASSAEGATAYLDADLRDPGAILDEAALTLDFSQPVAMRSHTEVSRFFDGLNLMEPGVVQLHRWHPGSDGPDRRRDLANYGGVGRKP